MTDSKWNKEEIPLRREFWLRTIMPFLESYGIKPDNRLLHFYSAKHLNSHGLINTFLDEGSIESHHLYERHQTSINEKIIAFENNSYHIVFLFLNLHLKKHERVPYFLEKIYNALKPTGRLLITIPTTNTSTGKSYSKLLESGMFPELKADSAYDDTAILETFKTALTNSSFVNFYLDTQALQFELPNIEMFRQYLSQVAYLYKSVVPREINQLVLDAQTQFYEDICQNNHHGKYIYEYELTVINATK